ncbi:MAG TPA: RdgB/HAM1 family non-canonical purine NTP pyrophosphatase [Gammaproteobacteria bacterium]|nr:RdgB/HAM1 family non-canonical purine NTP pyrophosphatase [Gammaproteobacteria bacterium]
MSGPRRVVVASGNSAKLEELRALLENFAVVLVPQAALRVPEAVECGETFEANALIKARNASRHTGLPAIADDSGLQVDALGGAPGVLSARYAGERASDEDNMNKLLAALAGVDAADRTARFICVLVYVENADDRAPVVCRGVWEGRIAEVPSGDGGFGYDPLFFVPSEGTTAAALAPERKNALSHRGQALRMLKHALTRRNA